MNKISFYMVLEAANKNNPNTTKTKTNTLNPDFLNPKQDQPISKVDPVDDLKKRAGIGAEPEKKIDIKKSSQQNTLNKTSGLTTPEMSDLISKMKKIDIDPDLEPYIVDEPDTIPDVHVDTKNLPAVAGEALLAAGFQDPEFHQVSNLPGNMSSAIRQLGKLLFGSFTSTSTKDIYMIADFGGNGPNSSQEVNAVAGFLKNEGENLGPGEIDFDNVFPGYEEQIHMYRAAGIRWMLVKDFAGKYIYCWPESDSKDTQTQRLIK